MKPWHRPPPAPEADEIEDWADSPQDAHAVAGTTGWVTLSTGATANLTTLMRWAAWALLLAGPLLAVAAWMRPPAAAGAPQTTAKAPVVQQDGAGPAGFAQLYVAAYVTAGQGSEASLAPYFPGMRDVSLTAASGAQHAERVAAVRVRDVSAGYWSVTVAARLVSDLKAAPAKDAAGQGDGRTVEVLRYFQVPVRGQGGGYVAAGLPAEVSAPALSGQQPKLAYGAPVPADVKDPATGAVAEFLAAYLSGTGQLDRYLSPGTTMAAVSPAPYRQVQVTQLAQRGGEFRANALVSAGAERNLLVDVTATDQYGQTRPLTYSLSLKARDGRWEIAALDAAPALNTDVNGAK